jgi:hypothetical protein
MKINGLLNSVGGYSAYITINLHICMCSCCCCLYFLQFVFNNYLTVILNTFLYLPSEKNDIFAPVLNMHSLSDTEEVARISEVSDCSPECDRLKSWLEHCLKFMLPFLGACPDSIWIQATTTSSHTTIGRCWLLIKYFRLHSSNIWRFSPIHYK